MYLYFFSDLPHTKTCNDNQVLCISLNTDEKFDCFNLGLSCLVPWWVLKGTYLNYLKSWFMFNFRLWLFWFFIDVVLYNLRKYYGWNMKSSLVHWNMFYLLIFILFHVLTGFQELCEMSFVTRYLLLNFIKVSLSFDHFSCVQSTDSIHWEIISNEHEKVLYCWYVVSAFIAYLFERIHCSWM